MYCPGNARCSAKSTVRSELEVGECDEEGGGGFKSERDDCRKTAVRYPTDAGTPAEDYTALEVA